MSTSTITPGSSTPRGTDFVQTLSRGLDVIRAFDRDHSAMTLSEIADRVGLARAVVRRLLITLEELGYVARAERDFFLTPRVLELGYSYLASLALPELAHSQMRALAKKVGESCSMAVLDGSEVAYVQRIPVSRVMTVALSVGARLPAFCTSMGRVLLAGLDESALQSWFKGRRFTAYTTHTITERLALLREIERTRIEGFCYVEQELELGLCSVAVPVKDGAGSTIAALNIGMSYRVDARSRIMKQVLPSLRATAAGLTQAWVSAHPAALRIR